MWVVVSHRRRLFGRHKDVFRPGERRLERRLALELELGLDGLATRGTAGRLRGLQALGVRDEQSYEHDAHPDVPENGGIEHEFPSTGAV